MSGGNLAFREIYFVAVFTTTFFPLLIGVIVGLNVALEEKASHFQTLLAVPNRHKNMLAKLTYLYGSGVFALFFSVPVICDWHGRQKPYF